MPLHSPLSLAKEKPGRPRWTPHSMWPRALMASSVGLGASCCAEAEPATKAAAAAAAKAMNFMKSPSTGAVRYRTSHRMASKLHLETALTPDGWQRDLVA